MASGMVKRSVVGVLLIGGLVTAWIYSEVRYAGKVRPPPSATNFQSFLQHGLEPRRFQRFDHGGIPYLRVFARMPSLLLALPSGPPVYVFNSKGDLIDWCGDSGDNGAFIRKWHGFAGATNVSIEQAREMLQSTGP